MNFTCPAPTDGVCGAIGAINSFVFLQNEHPGYYDSLLVPNGDEDQDPNDPATPVMVALALVGGRLQFDHPTGGTVFIDAAFSESAPEPALLLIGGGLAACARRSVTTRRRASQSR